MVILIVCVVLITLISEISAPDNINIWGYTNYTNVCIMNRFDISKPRFEIESTFPTGSLSTVSACCTGKFMQVN